MEEELDDSISSGHSTPEPQSQQPTNAVLQAQLENEQLLRTLSAVEKRVVLLLTSASEAVAQLANEADVEEAEEKFAESFQVYVQTLNEIQSYLRRIFRHLVKSGILAAAGRSIPYRASLAGEEMDLELAAKRVSLLLAEVENSLGQIKRDNSEESVVYEMKEEA
ncbi:hypothetical protein SpCBS45565_g00436 [Spizellomyces sp. 'palustris']|nr:hypothetical protein SpCBS45565_g00436 [Spizellomyces sp. 'palustris']